MKQAYRSGRAFIYALHFYFRSQLQKNINNYTRAPYIESLSLSFFLKLISYTRDGSTCFYSSHNIKNKLKTRRFRREIDSLQLNYYLLPFLYENDLLRNIHLHVYI